MEPKNEVTDLSVDEITLTAAPANEDAQVLVTKARAKAKAKVTERADDEMDDDELESFLAALDDEEVSTDDEKVTKSIDFDALDEAHEELAKHIEDLVAENAKLAEEVRVLKARQEADDPDALLAGVPEAVQKRVRDAEAEVAMLREQTATEDAIRKARQNGLPNPEVTGPLLRRVAAGNTTPDDAEHLARVLKSASEIAGKAGMFERLASPAPVDASDPEERLRLRAEEVRKSRPDLSAIQARAAVLNNDPELYAAMQHKRPQN